MVTRPMPIAFVTMFLTEACNLRCDYCYLSKQPQRMSEDTARRTVDFLLKEGRVEDEKGVEICFFGGEPLMEPGLMETICAYALESARRRTCRMGFSMTTNGTLFDARMLELVRRFQIQTTISLDGVKDVQDRHRKTRDGSGSFCMIEKNLPYLTQAPRAAIRMTVTPETVFDLVKSVSWCRDAGFRQVYVTPVLEADWGMAGILAYADAWEGRGRRYLSVSPVCRVF